MQRLWIGLHGGHGAKLRVSVSSSWGIFTYLRSSHHLYTKSGASPPKVLVRARVCVCARGRARCCVWRSSSLLSLSPAPLAVFCSTGCRGQYDNGAGATGSPPRPSGVDTHGLQRGGCGTPLLEVHLPVKALQTESRVQSRKTPLQIRPKERLLLINVLAHKKGQQNFCLLSEPGI